MNTLDSSAILVYFLRETGWERMKKILNEPCSISAVILAECAMKFAKKTDQTVTSAYGQLLAMNMTILPFSSRESGILCTSPTLTNTQLSLADRICLATAIAHNHTIVTADKLWATLGLPVKITQIR